MRLSAPILAFMSLAAVASAIPWSSADASADAFALEARAKTKSPALPPKTPALSSQGAANQKPKPTKVQKRDLRTMMRKGSQRSGHRPHRLDARAKSPSPKKPGPSTQALPRRSRKQKTEQKRSMYLEPDRASQYDQQHRQADADFGLNEAAYTHGKIAHAWHTINDESATVADNAGRGSIYLYQSKVSQGPSGEHMYKRGKGGYKSHPESGGRG